MKAIISIYIAADYKDDHKLESHTVTIFLIFMDLSILPIMIPFMFHAKAIWGISRSGQKIEKRIITAHIFTSFMLFGFTIVSLVELFYLAPAVLKWQKNTDALKKQSLEQAMLN